MQYMILIYSNPADRPKFDTPEFHALMQDYAQLGIDLRAAGAHISGDALLGVETARTLRGRGAEAVVMDGPFAETREHLGGYYLIEAPDMEAALTWARRIPTAAHGAVEVRQLMNVGL